MKLKFRKILALASSALMLGMTAGIASAANYPAPFVVGGSPNVAIVYGSGAALSDSTAAGSIATSLSSFVTGVSNVSVTGSIPIDKGTSSRIWLNTSLNNAQSVFTASDLPTLLATGSFSGAQTATITPEIVLVSGTNAGGDFSDKVEFSKRPTSSVDPTVGVSMGTGTTSPLYNATIIFGTAINFTATASQGPTLTLFGKPYVVSSSTTAGASGQLVLFQSAQTLTLVQGGTGSATATATINGVSHTIGLINAGTSSATISVDGTSQSVNVGSSITINGVSIAVTSVQSSTAGGNTATVLVGANQLTFKNGQSVTQGTNNQVILGTTAYFGGTPDSLTSLTIAVYSPDTSHGWIGRGQSFTDPVFGNFAITNNGLSSDITDTTRDSIKIITAGATTLDLSIVDKLGNAWTGDWATNASGNYNLSTSSGYNIYPFEMANLTLNSYTLTGTSNSNNVAGELLQLQTVYNGSGGNSSGTGYLNDYVQFYDPIRKVNLRTQTPTATGSANLITPDGRTYAVTYGGAAGSSLSAWAQIKYPSSDSGVADQVLYPTLLLNTGESVGLYAPLYVNLSTSNGTVNSPVANYWFPNGNGLTSVAIAYTTGNATAANWTIGGTSIITATNAASFNSSAKYVNVTVGRLVYNFSVNATNQVNVTQVTLLYPGPGATVSGGSILEPALVMFEGKDVSNNYNAVVIDTIGGTTKLAGTSTNGVGVAGIYFSSGTNYGSGTTGVQLFSNSNLQQYMDGFGTLVTKDSTNSGQPIATMTYPSQQAYEQLFIGAGGAVTGGALGNVLVTDSQLSTVAQKNLIIVGGSCINTVAATLVGGAYCGSAWTSATGVGTGQFLIKSYTSPFDLPSGTAIAVLVAGYEAADTTNAATYLSTQTVDTGKAYKGTSSTIANLIVQ